MFKYSCVQVQYETKMDVFPKKNSAHLVVPFIGERYCFNRSMCVQFAPCSQGQEVVFLLERLNMRLQQHGDLQRWGDYWSQM